MDIITVSPKKKLKPQGLREYADQTKRGDLFGDSGADTLLGGSQPENLNQSTGIKLVGSQRHDVIDWLSGDVWFWKAKPGSCEACQDLDGRFFHYGDLPERPHPNCKCEILRCEVDVEYEDWKTYKTDTRYQVVPAFDAFLANTGTATWKRITTRLEKRAIKRVAKCPDGRTQLVGRDIEYRKQTDTDVKTVKAFRFSTGGDIQDGDAWFSNNPWTGESVGGSMATTQ